MILTLNAAATFVVVVTKLSLGKEGPELPLPTDDEFVLFTSVSPVLVKLVTVSPVTSSIVDS